MERYFPGLISLISSNILTPKEVVSWIGSQGSTCREARLPVVNSYVLASWLLVKNTSVTIQSTLKVYLPFMVIDFNHG